MASQIEFVLNGSSVRVDRASVIEAVSGVDAEPVRTHQVFVDGREFPVKQVFELATGVDRLDFTSAIARKQLARLGFKVTRA